MSDQILRSGTAVGALLREVEFAQSPKDFIHKMYISLKEANETDYWLALFHAVDFIDNEQYISLEKDCQELIKMLVSSIKTMKAKHNL